MGDRWYYVTTLTFAEVAKWIRTVDEVHEREELKTWIQRTLRPERTQEIANYLLKQKQRFFNAIVVGVYGGDPEWFPIEVGESKTLKDVEIGERQATAFGFLQLSGAEEIFAIDGQHRVEGIKEALKRNKKAETDELVVIFVSHKRTVEGRERTRRLFTTLNKYAKPVSRAELIALNDDDAFAIITRRLIDSYKGLDSGFVAFATSANIPSENQTCITTIISLYDLVKTVCVPLKSKERKQLEAGPPVQKRIDELYEQTVEFWDALKANIPAIRKVTNSSPSDNEASKFRTKDGGHLLFRPAGLHGFARSVRILVDRGASVQGAVRKLSKVPLQLDEQPWTGVLWNSATQTMIVRHKKLVTNLFLHVVGAVSYPPNYETLDQYRKVVGDVEARISRTRR